MPVALFSLEMSSIQLVNRLIAAESELGSDKIKKGTFTIPILALLSIWLVYTIEIGFGFNFNKFGIYPKTIVGLRGILFSPFIHNSESINHIFSNSIPMLILGTSLFYFYREIAFRVFIGIWLTSGFWLWVLSRPSYHIGASGIVYGLAFFLFF